MDVEPAGAIGVGVGAGGAVAGFAVDAQGDSFVDVVGGEVCCGDHVAVALDGGGRQARMTGQAAGVAMDLFDAEDGADALGAFAQERRVGLTRDGPRALQVRHSLPRTQLSWTARVEEFGADHATTSGSTAVETNAVPCRWQPKQAREPRTWRPRARGCACVVVDRADDGGLLHLADLGAGGEEQRGRCKNRARHGHC